MHLIMEFDGHFMNHVVISGKEYGFGIFFTLRQPAFSVGTFR